MSNSLTYHSSTIFINKKYILNHLFFYLIKTEKDIYIYKIRIKKKERKNTHI